MPDSPYAHCASHPQAPVVKGLRYLARGRSVPRICVLPLAIGFPLLAIGCGAEDEGGRPSGSQGESFEGAPDPGSDWRDWYPAPAELLILEDAEELLDQRWERLQAAEAELGDLAFPDATQLDPQVLEDALRDVYRSPSDGDSDALACLTEGSRCLGSGCSAHGDFGCFVRPLAFEEDCNWREGEVMKGPFVFDDKGYGTQRVAPAWSEELPWTWNGASIPKPMRWALGEPKEGCYAMASIHHDFYYQTAWNHGMDRSDVDRIFYRGMRASGMNRWRAKSFYWGVCSAGWLFYNDSNGAAAMEPTAEQEEAFLQAWSEVMRYCWLDDPDLEELESLPIESIEPGFALFAGLR